MINCRFFIVVSDKTAGSFNRSRATLAIALDRVWRAVLLRKLKFYGMVPHPLPYSRETFNRYFDRFHDFSVTVPRCYKDVYVSTFFHRTHH